MLLSKDARRKARAENRRPWAWTAPVLCAFHCAATPLLVGLLPALALTSTAEWVLMSASVVLATVVVRSGIRVHRNRGIPALAALGFLVWVLSLAHAFEPVPEVATTVVGALLVAGALLWNANSSARAHGSTCSDCERCEAEPRASASSVKPESGARSETT
jgi:FtsH-binding integral membrane protein